MRITGFDTVVVDFYRTNLVFVVLRTDEGLTGVAEATLEVIGHRPAPPVAAA